MARRGRGGVKGLDVSWRRSAHAHFFFSVYAFLVWRTLGARTARARACGEYSYPTQCSSRAGGAARDGPAVWPQRGCSSGTRETGSVIHRCSRCSRGILSLASSGPARIVVFRSDFRRPFLPAVAHRLVLRALSTVIAWREFACGAESARCTELGAHGCFGADVRPPFISWYGPHAALKVLLPQRQSDPGLTRE